MNNHNSSRPKDKNADQTKVNLPYFDFLLTAFSAGNETLASSFGRHVHWGYWPDPTQATLTTEDFSQATEALSQQVCSAASIDSGMAVLDVGCGFGGTIAHINENYTTMQLVGLNLDERQLQRARTTVNAMPGNQIEFKQGNACALPFADHSFDVVLAVECVFHFPDREQFFKEAYRVLKPNGYLALSDFLPNTRRVPLMALKLPGWSFYGQCNLSCDIRDYHQLAAKTQFAVTAERDITCQTLPTYSYLRRLALQQRVTMKMAALETLAIELLSRLNWVNYYILGFHK